MYVIGTCLINIVCLNILISVVTDCYDLVMQRIESEDFKFKAGRLLIFETLQNYYNKMIRNKCCKPKGKKTPKYLKIIRYLEIKDNKKENEGKFKEMQDAISSVKKDVQEKFNEIKKRQDFMIESNHRQT